MPTPWAVDADPEPLTPEGEVLALLGGIRVYMLRWVYGHYELDWRDETKQRLYPRGPNQGFDVLTEHSCSRRNNLPRQKQQTPKLWTSRNAVPPPMNDDGTPPF